MEHQEKIKTLMAHLETKKIWTTNQLKNLIFEVLILDKTPGDNSETKDEI